MAELLKNAMELARAGFDPRVAVARRLDGLREVETYAEHPEAQSWSYFGLMVRAAGGPSPELAEAWLLVDELAPGGSALLWAETPERSRLQVLSLLSRAYARAVRLPSTEVLEPGAMG